MARPRVFVSSTYYDLKHIRTSLEIFIQSLGYDAILSEKGSVAYTPDAPLDESCYREAQSSDIYVLIIGGRYGAEVSETRSRSAKAFYDRYESITKHEYKSAIHKDTPVYVLIEKPVYSEYQTFEKNRDNKNIRYAHVDSVNIFHFIEEILAQSRNNPVHTFDRHSEIEAWLREQWEGLFRELIQRLSSQKQISSLSAQVSELAEQNKTLKTYLEQLLVSQVTPEKSEEIISAEDRRLGQARKQALLNNNFLLDFLHNKLGIDADTIFSALTQAKNVKDFLDNLEGYTGLDEEAKGIFSAIKDAPFMRSQFRDARNALNLEPDHPSSPTKGTSEKKVDETKKSNSSTSRGSKSKKR